MLAKTVTYNSQNHVDTLGSGLAPYLSYVAYWCHYNLPVYNHM